MLAPSIRPAIHSIYGFVRFADEIVDTFHNKDKKLLLDKFEWDFYQSLQMGISLNPILHSFQKTIKEYKIDVELVDAFMKSMRMDIEKKDYPSMLITTSLFDNRVLYSEPVKYIAKLRDIKTDNNIQLLKCKMEAAGHGGMSGRDNAITELAEEYSFILKTAKILN